MGTIALLAAIAGLIWVWARGTRRDLDQLRDRQQRWAQQQHDQPVELTNPDFLTGPPGPGVSG